MKRRRCCAARGALSLSGWASWPRMETPSYRPGKPAIEKGTVTVTGNADALSAISSCAKKPAVKKAAAKKTTAKKAASTEPAAKKATISAAKPAAAKTTSKTTAKKTTK